MIDDPDQALTVEVLGLQLVAYLCGVEVEQIERRLAGDGGLDDAPEETLVTNLVPLIREVISHHSSSTMLQREVALQALAEWDAQSGTVVANRLRMAAGADIPEPPDDPDATIHRLFHLARDAYPLLLAPEPHSPLSVLALRHPARADFDSRVASDPLLSQLFPDEDAIGRRGAVRNNLGRGQSVQSMMLAPMLLASAWDQSTMRSVTPSFDEFIERLRENVDALRQAVSHAEPHVRALVVFTGIKLADGAAISTPWGLLRPLTDAERSAAPADLDGAVQSTNSAGDIVRTRYSGEIVLETSVPYTLVFGSADLIERGSDITFDGAQALHRCSEAIQLATLLSVERQPGLWPNARFAWQWIADPLSFGRSLSWSNTQAMPGFVPHELSGLECQRLSSCVIDIDKYWVPQIDVSVRRVLSAAHARVNPADRMVDAIIAWENLFGTAEGEPRFRITAAMAWLLAENPAERRKLQADMKRLYDMRSQIVHGATLGKRDLFERADTALDYAVRSLTKLFGERSDLTQLPDGAARSLSLVLDAPE